jgi:serine/threonine-protein kinase RsbW
MSLTMFFAAELVTAQRWRRSFPGEPSEAANVRRFIGMLLGDCPFLDEVLLATGELVVNALRHTKSGGPGGAFTVEIGRSGPLVAVAVTDQGGPTEPTAVVAGELDEAGRGLRMVSAVATGWGWFGNEQARTVAAVFAASGASWVAAA